MARTKKHHFLPQFYLRGFATESHPNQIWRIEKTAEARSQLVSITDTGAKSDYHTVDRGGIKDSHSIEHELSKLERIHSATISRILRKNQEPTGSDREALIGFVSLMRMRVPLLKRFVESQIVANAKILNAMLAKDGRLEEITKTLSVPVFENANEGFRRMVFERMRKMLREHRYTIKITNGHLLRLMFQLAFDDTTLGVLRRMRLTVRDAPTGFWLVTCDQPVALFQHQTAPAITPAGLLDPRTELSIPLSSRCLLRLDWSGGPDGRGMLSAEQVAEFNRRTVIMAENVVYASQADAAMQRVVQEYHSRRAGFRTLFQHSGEDRACLLTGFVPVLATGRPIRTATDH